MSRADEDGLGMGKTYSTDLPLLDCTLTRELGVVKWTLHLSFLACIDVLTQTCPGGVGWGGVGGCGGEGRHQRDMLTIIYKVYKGVINRISYNMHVHI